MDWLPFDLGIWAALWLALWCFIAAFVRGYSGFGFAALVVTPGSLVTDPMNLVPMVVIADIAMTAQQARGIGPHVQWWRVRWLFIGCILGVPLGVWIMGQLGADLGRAVIAIYILAMCAALMTGWKAKTAGGPSAHLGTGALSGIANGAAVGGLPVAVFFASQPLSAAAFRATNIVYYTALDLWTLPVMIWAGLVTMDTLLATVLGLPFMLVGIWAGGRRFLSAEPASFRRFAIVLLAGMAILALGRSLF